MRKHYSWYVYVGAVLLGLTVVVVASPLLRAEGAARLGGVGLLAAVYAAVGGALATALPRDGWRWGLWLVSPLWFLTLFSLAFTGGVRVFLEKDIAILVTAAAAATAGAHAVTRLSHPETRDGRTNS